MWHGVELVLMVCESLFLLSTVHRSDKLLRNEAKDVADFFRKNHNGHYKSAVFAPLCVTHCRLQFTT